MLVLIRDYVTMASVYVRQDSGEMIVQNSTVSMGVQGMASASRTSVTVKSNTGE